MGYLTARLRSETLGHDPQGAVGYGERLGGEDPGELLVHPLLVADHADEERRPAGVGEDHGGGYGAHQLQGLLGRRGDQQYDDHLQDLGVEGGEEGNPGIEQGIHPVRSHQPPVHQAPQQPLAGGGDGAGEIGKAPQGIAMQSPGQPYQEAHHGAPQQPSQHGADGAGIGDGIVYVQPHIGAQYAEAGEDDVYQYLVRKSDRVVGQGAQQGTLGKEVGNDQADAHLLEQGED
ncbi:hypothetical protein D3C84_809040 [compost metagenome]